MLLNADMTILCGTAASIAVVHTLLGPDHYLPFIAMSRAGQWRLRKTLFVTLACGVGHVLGSVAIGGVGIALGMSLFSVEALESFRGELAAWLLLAFGSAYFVWGVRRAIRNRPHTHWHAHANGTTHRHEHVHREGHVHVHQESSAPDAESGTNPMPADGRANSDTTASFTPWVLFLLFLFGPCETLIPILMYPAARGRMLDVVVVAAVFGLTTLASMVTVVGLAHVAAGRISLGRFERYAHAVSGFVVLLCGVAVKAGW